MDSRQIVRRTLACDYPERVARSYQNSDFVSSRPNIDSHATDWKEISPSRWERKDGWGNTWNRIDPTSKGEVERGMLEEFSDLDTYAFPTSTIQKAMSRSVDAVPSIPTIG
ncbi:MAG: hypothetical protein CME19_21010 [Gemmatimonadetes bacterium]|nr:hypothetical protein [Gemmatimonadota bacterium]